MTVLALPVAFVGCGDETETPGTNTVGKQNPGASETSDDPGETVTNQDAETDGEGAGADTGEPDASYGSG